MEEFLPFIIGIGYFIYKTYTNFRKEQEKARKRNPRQPVPQEKADDLHIPGKPKPERPVLEPEPLLVEEVREERPSYEPKYKPTYREPRVESPSKVRSVEILPAENAERVDLVNPERPAAEVLHNRAIHGKHGHRFEPYIEEEQPAFEFDMEDAIIKEAILNRPQY